MALSKNEIITELFNYYQFEDCLLLDLRWNNFGTGLKLLFDYVWTDTNGCFLNNGFPTQKENKDRNINNSENLITMEFKLVYEYQVYNGFNISQIDNPDEVNSTINIISLVKLSDDNLFLSKYRHISNNIHHLSINWENDKRIDVVFTELLIHQI